MSGSKLCFLFLCLAVSACAAAPSPEDATMSNALCAQGKLLLADGKIRDARDVYASATNRDRDNARAWNGLGVTNDLLGKREDAADAYEQAIDLDAHDLNAINNLAHLSMEAGDYDKAVKILKPVVDKDGGNVTMRQNLAQSYALTGDTDNAAHLLRIDMSPAQADAQMEAYRKMSVDKDAYADLGSYPTDGMARAHVAEIRKVAGSDARDWTIDVVPEVKVSGGTPMFTIRITGQSPQSICDILNPQALPCVPNGK